MQGEEKPDVPPALAASIEKLDETRQREKKAREGFDASIRNELPPETEQERIVREEGEAKRLKNVYGPQGPWWKKGDA